MKRFVPTAYLAPALVLVAILLAWYSGAGVWEAGLRGDGFEPAAAEATRQISLPLPHEILSGGWKARELLWRGALITMRAAIIGFLLAGTVGYALALFLVSARWIKDGFYPWVLVFQMTPVVIIAPIINIWITDEVAAITSVAFIIGFFPVVANSVAGLTLVDRNLEELMTSFNATKLQEILFLRIPSSLPFYLTGLRIAATLAPIGAITGDVLVGSGGSSGGGLGYLVYVFKSQVKISELFATALTACLLGFLFIGSVNFVRRALLKNWVSEAAL